MARSAQDMRGKGMPTHAGFPTTAKGEESAPIAIKARISFRQYAILLFRLTYAKPALIVIVSVGLLMAAWVLGYGVGLSFLPAPQFYQYTTLALIFVVQPLFIFSTIRRTYVSSDHLREPLEMVFDGEQIRITGKYFYTELSWAGLFKVVELRDWFMIYQNTLTAVLVPKRAFKGRQQREFKRLLGRVGVLDLRLRVKD
jgi:hypothetical protein